MVFTQLAKRAVRPLGRGWQDVADLDVAVGDDHTVNEQFDELALLFKGGLGEPELHPLAEVLH